MNRVAVPLLALVIVGCGSQPVANSHPAPRATPAPADPWSVTCTDSADPTPALLWNGLIGVLIGRDGTGMGLPFFMIDSYETMGEEKILSLPNPLAIEWKSGTRTLSPKDASSYRQTLDFQSGMLTTEWKASVSDGKSYTYRCETAIDPSRRVLAQRFSIEGSGLEWELVDHVNGNAGQPSIVTFAMSGEKAFITTSNRTTLRDGYSIERVASMGVGSANRTISQIAKRKPGSLVPTEPPPTFEMVAEASRAAWKKRWETDIEIDGPVEDQQAVRSFLFYLRSAIAPEGPMSISPCGLSNQQYNGHVFWDADIWVFPALAFVDPELARSITDYRLARTYPAELAAFGGQFPTDRVAPEIRFPWESSVSGKETAPPQFQKELHVTGSVLFQLQIAVALGLTNLGNVRMIINEGGMFFAAKSTETEDGRELRNVLSPDESHEVDNDLYTSLLAQWCGNGGSWKWRPGTLSVFKLPQDKTSFLTYDNDPVRGYKQAAAVLAIYPLQYPPAEKQAEVMMNRFADKVTPNGPAMSDSLHALIWARLGKTDVAYTTWRKSWMDFTNHPLLLFSEKRKKDVTYFTTGAAGCLQTVLYGFLGFRIDEEEEPGAAWSKQLLGGRWLSIRPHLPQAWKAVKLKNFSLLGRRYTCTATHESVQVSQGVP